MIAFTITEWVILILVFLLGLFIGMAFLAGGKWKRRYRDEVARREAAEQENARLHREARELDSLRHSAAKAPPPRHDEDRRL
ncbi:LapA family protein [Allosphingosinicella vermicomposti]|uniref:LapA family protein n=1 Tax=Allosphingosinicella vermicomposti TaxID=614671 RepID=UPI000D0F3AAC|nr:LapA family protein [Allosphingosinicella vermicomposti]